MPKNRAIPAIAFGLLLMPMTARAQGLAQPPAGQAPAGFATPSIGPNPPGTPPKEEPPTEAERALDDAIAKLRTLKSFSAEIVQAAEILGQKFEVKGNCLRAPGNRIYLKLAVEGLGDASATTLQVCDGTVLWNYQKVLDSQTYHKFTITQILKKLNDPVLEGNVRETILTQLGFAGPEILLMGLRKTIRFDQKRAATTTDGKKVWVLGGKWKDRTGLTGPNNQPVPAVGPLPPYIPSNVAVWVGQDDGVPYKLEMYGDEVGLLADARRFGPDGRPIGPKAVPAARVEPTRIVQTYLNVKLNTAIPPESFGFQAPDAKNVVDRTDDFLAQLDQAIQAETMRKKAEPPGKGEPATLPTAINAPKAP